MKRILAVAVALLVLGVASVNQASAWPAAVKWVYEPLSWRTSASNSVGYVDSAQFSHAALEADTSVAIPVTSVWALPNLDATSADSTVWAVLYIKGRSGASTTQGTDSVYVDVQVSVDGTNWVTTTPTRGYNTGTTHGGMICLEQSSADSYGIPIKVLTAGTGLRINIDGPVGGATAPSWIQLWGWPFLRFIVNSDCNGSFIGEVGHWAFN